MKKQVSIVICVYNEENTIANVVRKCRKYNPKSEIVVVNDGSSDGTDQVLTQLKKKVHFEYILMPENKGKSNAMVCGVENARNEIILFFDADIKGIKKKHFKKLVEPLQEEEPKADMVLGTPSDTLIDYRINPFVSLTGERAMFREDFMKIAEDVKDIRFGVETYINLYFQAHRKKIKYVLLKGLLHPSKYAKTSTIQATTEFISEGKEISSTLISNYDLILKRIGNTFDDRSEKVKESFKTLQQEINDKLQTLLRNNG